MPIDPSTNVLIPWNRRRLGMTMALVGGLTTGIGSMPTLAEVMPSRAEIWDIEIGMRADQISSRSFIRVSCGTDGGPPSFAIAGFEDFRRCPMEKTGLREVNFQYDDELEYWARANEFMTWIARFGGTKVFDQPAIVSILFDECGVVGGLRIVSDPRVDPSQRQSAIMLGKLLRAKFGSDAWTCEDLPLDEGETSVGSSHVKQRCRQHDPDGRLLKLGTNYFRKRGQTAFDPHTGQAQPGYFEASTRFEIFDASVFEAAGAAGVP